MELMKEFEDNYFDLAIVDPPYGINMDGGKIGGDNAGRATDYIKKDWDRKAPEKEYFIELMRVSKNQIFKSQFLGVKNTKYRVINLRKKSIFFYQ